MTKRDGRKPVMIAAQMRDSARWSPVCIRNISSRGMMLQMFRPPARGSYVELRRVDSVVVAKVMWSADGRCGLRTHHRGDVDALVAGKAPLSPTAVPVSQVEHPTGRGAEDVTRTAERAAVIGRHLQFVFAAGLGAMLVLLLGYVAHRALAQPINVLARALR